MEDFGRKVHKPDIVVDYNDVGLLTEDETMTNQEFASIFFNTGVFDETSKTMVFSAEVINKFNRFLAYQRKLEPLKEKLVLLQFEKYFENSDVNKGSSKVLTISLLGEFEMKNITVFASKEDGEFVYVSLKNFKRMLKLLEDETIQFLKAPEEEQFISLRIWAFDNDFDMEYSDQKLEITNESDQPEEVEEKKNEETEETSRYGYKHNLTGCEESQGTQAKDTNALTITEYNSIFNTDYIESGEDIEIKPSIIEKLSKLISNMEAIKPIRHTFANYNVKQFIDEDLNIDKFKIFQVYVNRRAVAKIQVFQLSNVANSFHVSMRNFKLILMRAGSYYAIYLDGEKEELVDLKKWVDENCGEIQADDKELRITFK